MDYLFFYYLYIFCMYVCPRCGNKDPRYIGLKSGQPYCRKCIGFIGREALENSNQSFQSLVKISYELSQEQKEASEKIVNAIRSGNNVLVSAVCGSGKTELTFEVIRESLIKGQQVGFAIPRRDVVIEIYRRLKSIFPHNKVVAVYGGHNETLEGEIIVLTTHQLYRYVNYFDVLIMDEIDAFPFAGDDVLQAMFKRSLRGHFILMSATLGNKKLSEFSKSGGQVVALDTRYHRHPLPEPKIVIMLGILKLFFLIRKLREFIQLGKPVFVFTPTIAKCEDVAAFINKWVRGGAHVHSQLSNRDEIIEAFRNGEYKYLVTTAVLERGVTVKNLQVIIYESDHSIYTASALIQIAGRVGRKKDAPEGEVIFLSDRTTKAMEEAICEIRNKNKSLSHLL